MSSKSSSSNFLRLVKRYGDIVNSLSTLRRNEVVSTVTTRKSTAPTALPLMQIVTNLHKLFPLSIQESITDYCQFNKNKEQFQEDLLSILPYYPNPSNEFSSQIIRTPIDEQGNFINEFEIVPKGVDRSSKKLKHVILVHGYGAGLGFFLKNFDGLLSGNTVLHAIDLPGYGFSSRPKFPFNYPRDSYLSVEAYFHDALYNWFKKRGLVNQWENNYVVAHSMGAYLFSLYANKYKHFKKLFMCSPGGVSKNSSMPTPPWWFVKLWDWNISPFSLVRNSGQLGSKLVSGWSSRRFGLNYKFFNELHHYTYGIFNQPGSGEYMLSFMLGCGGWPRIPLESRLFCDENFNGRHLDWVWLYGDGDWMDVNGGKRVNDFLVERGVSSKLEIIPRAGHHIYWDNDYVFNRIINEEINM